jgi:hypothetical protein
MGEYQNIRNAFPIISTLLFQGGSAGVQQREGFYQLNLDQTSAGGSGRPLLNAVTFYTNFNNVSNTLYSWNRTLPSDREQFISERLGVYFGFGSEVNDIKNSNPNLNFALAEVPQSAAATTRRTYGRFYGLAVPKQALNQSGAYIVQTLLVEEAVATKIATAYQMAPVYRTQIQAGSNDIYGRVIYQAAPIARGWLNPDMSQVDGAFTKMLEDISAGRESTAAAVTDVLGRLQALY